MPARPTRKPDKPPVPAAAPAAAKPPAPTRAAASAGSSLPIGSPAPDFSLPASDGNTVRLSTLRGRWVVLYFYPKADTPGCTTQACGFNEALDAIAKAGAVVLGVSPDPEKAVTRFAAKYALRFPLLADADHAVCDAYGVWTEKSMYGRTYWGAARTTYVIDPAGRIAQAFEKVKPPGHDAQVLEWLAANARSVELA